MRNPLHQIAIAALVLFAGLGVVEATSGAFNNKAKQGDYTRSPVPVPGAWTAIACTNAVSASSSALNPDTRYWVVCGSDAYLRWGSSSATSTSSDAILPGGAWLEFTTDDSTLYLACLNVTTTSGCKVLEVR
jgi:hypothetical protein